jgi:hypothetical protein
MYNYFRLLYSYLEYTYDFGPISERTMIYYYKARLDGLSKRYETFDELTDYFIDRDDFLESRKAVFDSTDKNIQRSITVTIFENSLLEFTFSLVNL